MTISNFNWATVLILKKNSLCIKTIDAIFDFIRVNVAFVQELSSKIIHNSYAFFIGI